MSDLLKHYFEKLMALGPAAAEGRRAFRYVGQLIDLSGDFGREDGTERALQLLDELSKRKLTARQAALLEYFRANAWSNRYAVVRRTADLAWGWEQPELQKQVFHLRRAAGGPGFAKLPSVRRCQVLTNLGNLLRTVGRSVEAVATWSRALTHDPRFGMALGNRGYGLMHYAENLYDPGHRGVFLYFAHLDLSAAVSGNARFEKAGGKGPKAFFAGKKSEIELVLDLKTARRRVKMDGYPLGSSRAERRYRMWALQERLFLNPLNDLGAHSIAARDILSLPDFVTPLGESPTLIGFFNQMKQEYVSARWLLFEGLHSARVHFSDRQVTLHNTLDFPSYSLAVEKTKDAYRAAYSLFDKIAFFLNDYAALKVDLNKVYFKSIWYPTKGAVAGVRDEFRNARNLPLRGLYWVSKDLFEPAIQEAMEPEAKALYAIRNHLEHRYLKLHDIAVPQTGNETYDKMWIDRLAFSLQRDEFEAKTLHVLKLARAALIYLSLAMHREERRRDAGKPDEIRAPMLLPTLEDRWRR